MSNYLYIQAVNLLKQLISTPSFSTKENETANILVDFFTKQHIPCKRVGNNVYASNKNYDVAKPTILLNSHHDTVMPNSAYTLHPFTPIEMDGKLYGLGSNDAGGCLVALAATFIYFYNAPSLKYNIVFAATAEEEISGKQGIEMLLPYLGNINCAIVGEPTQLQLAIAERGLLVMDCTAIGKAGHAATVSGENALYIAVADIQKLQKIEFDKVSELLGKTKLTVTSVETENKQHNVVPASCQFVIDVRLNELYTFNEVIKIIQMHIKSICIPRSNRLKSTSISMQHPLVVAGLKLGKLCYGSPTLSDKALMPFAALKMGPGSSARSHIADEFIYINEIETGIETYINLLQQLLY
jgi:acetylornithine deacetylase